MMRNRIWLAPHSAQPPWQLALRLATGGGVPRRSMKIALVVGTALNLINQGDAIVTDIGAVVWWKLALTIVVPYLVSTYGAVSFGMALQRQPRAR